MKQNQTQCSIVRQRRSSLVQQIGRQWEKTFQENCTLHASLYRHATHFLRYLTYNAIVALQYLKLARHILCLGDIIVLLALTMGPLPSTTAGKKRHACGMASDMLDERQYMTVLWCLRHATYRIHIVLIHPIPSCVGTCCCR